MYVYLLSAIICEVVATTALNASNGFTKLWASLIVICGYGAAFYLLSLTLRDMKVGIAYAIWSALGIVLVTGVSAIVYKQKIDVVGMTGMGLMIVGVMLLMVFSNASVH
ncbi:Multidrug transporter EmrE [Poriferisphaera corsica]|uniref:Multidrug transporter EmrE n=2 Tax=Poriferisphaera corsica TaxID=2528020 RepID=A0A517YW49_9BACT|nr:Multidrug transporter EmrE [Poriferisphaera corsica]